MNSVWKNVYESLRTIKLSLTIDQVTIIPQILFFVHSTASLRYTIMHVIISYIIVLNQDGQ